MTVLETHNQMLDFIYKIKNIFGVDCSMLYYTTRVRFTLFTSNYEYYFLIFIYLTFISVTRFADVKCFVK